MRLFRTAFQIRDSQFPVREKTELVMSPTQQRVELDMDRKEELILAKQLRACRVQILPRVSRW